MLSSSEIKNYEFKKGIGYSKKSVDEFISEIVREYEAVCKENIELKDKATVLSEGLQYYKSIEKTLQKALVLAQKASEEEQAKASRKARIIERTAHTKADEVLTRAKSELDNVFRQTDELNRRFELYKAHVKNLVTTQLDLINSDAYNISVNDLEGYLKLKEKLEDSKYVNPEENEKNNSNGDVGGEEVSEEVKTDEADTYKADDIELDIDYESLFELPKDEEKENADDTETSENNTIDYAAIIKRYGETDEMAEQETQSLNIDNKGEVKIDESDENVDLMKENLINSIPDETVETENTGEGILSEGNETDTSLRRIPAVNIYRNGESEYEQNP